MAYYVEYAYGSTSNRGHIRAITQLDLVHNARKLGEELYRSLFLYDDEIIEHFKVFKTVRSYRGNVYLENILLDVDYKNRDIMIAVRMLIEDLFDNWKLSEEQIRLSYSGRGFHIAIPNIFDFKPSPELHLDVKNTIKKYFPLADDIYDKTRIIRVINTINKKSGLYKIPLKLDEIKLSYEEIRKLASKPRNVDVISRFDGYPKYPELIVREQIYHENKEDYSRIITCAQKMYNSEPITGERHKTMILMASIYRREGIPKEGIRAMLKHWARNEVDIQEYEIDRLVDDVWDKDYRYSCNNELMKKYCDSRCIFYRHKNYSLANISILDAEKHFEKLISIPKEKIIDLNSVFPSIKSFKIYPSEVITFIGDTGLNKSTLMNNLMIKIKKPLLYINTENSNALVYRRLLQIKMGLSKEEIESYYRAGNRFSLDDLKYINVYTGNIQTTSLKHIVGQYNIELLIIDVIEDLETGDKDEYTKLKEIMTSLRELANGGLIVFAVHHVSKNGIKDQRGKIRALDVHSGKGNSVVEQKSDKVIGIEGIQNSEYRILRVLKARDENPFTIQLQFNNQNYRLEECDAFIRN